MSKSYFKDTKLKNEYYIAPFYQYGIDNNLKVKIFRAQQVKVYGTPKKLYNF